jgi:restriction system protein
MKRLWLVRLGKSGDGEAAALETSNLVLGFHVESPAGAKDGEAVLAIGEKCMSDLNPRTQLNFAAQLNQFCNQMQVGDLIVVPLKTTSQIAVGEVAGPYAHTAHNNVSSHVKWLKQHLPAQRLRAFDHGADLGNC